MAGSGDALSRLGGGAARAVLRDEVESDCRGSAADPAVQKESFQVRPRRSQLRNRRTKSVPTAAIGGYTTRQATLFNRLNTSTQRLGRVCRHLDPLVRKVRARPA